MNTFVFTGIIWVNITYYPIFLETFVYFIKN